MEVEAFYEDFNTALKERNAHWVPLLPKWAANNMNMLLGATE